MPFSSGTLVFFRGLARNNKKPWFEAHRAVYEQDVVAPMRELIEEIDVRLARFAPEIMGHPKRSMFRIYRDVRFSKDKSPYKTNAGCWFWHRDADPRVGDSAEGAGRVSTFTSSPATRSPAPVSGCRRARCSVNCAMQSSRIRAGLSGSCRIRASCGGSGDSTTSTA